MYPDGDEEDGREGEEDDGVDEDGGAAGLEVAELDEAAALGRQLQQQPRREQHEQHHRHHHRAPVRHLAHSLLLLPLAGWALFLSLSLGRCRGGGDESLSARIKAGRGASLADGDPLLLPTKTKPNPKPVLISFARR